MTATTPRFCPACGTSVAAGDRFCGHCGASLGEPAVAAPPPPAASRPPDVPPPPVAPTTAGIPGLGAASYVAAIVGWGLSWALGWTLGGTLLHMERPAFAFYPDPMERFLEVLTQLTLVPYGSWGLMAGALAGALTARVLARSTVTVVRVLFVAGAWLAAMRLGPNWSTSLASGLGDYDSFGRYGYVAASIPAGAVGLVLGLALALRLGGGAKSLAVTLVWGGSALAGALGLHWVMTT